MMKKYIGLFNFNLRNKRKKHKMPDVSVRLRDIDEGNWMDIVLLSSVGEGEEKVLGKYTASNALSICQALYEETWEVKGIYCGKTPVGFAMYGYCKEREQYELCRLMIDCKHQNKGFGNIAVSLCLDELFTIEDCNEVYLLVNKDNETAKHIYLKNGFEPNGEMIGEEMVYCVGRKQ